MRVHVSVLPVLEIRHDLMPGTAVSPICKRRGSRQLFTRDPAVHTMALSPHVGKGWLQAARLAVGSWVFYHRPSRHWSPNSLHLERDQGGKGVSTAQMCRRRKLRSPSPDLYLRRPFVCIFPSQRAGEHTEPRGWLSVSCSREYVTWTNLPSKDCLELNVGVVLTHVENGDTNCHMALDSFGYLANFKQIIHIAPYLQLFYYHVPICLYINTQTHYRCVFVYV